MAECCYLSDISKRRCFNPLTINKYCLFENGKMRQCPGYRRGE